MIRKDYDAVHNLMLQFTKDWNSRNINSLCDYIRDDVKFYVSTYKAYPDGGRHGLNGVQNFVNELPETSYLRMDLYNFLAGGEGNESCATGIICGTAASKEEWKTCQFVFQIAASFRKYSDSWYFTEIRMDLSDCSGNFEELVDTWYMGEPKAYWYEGVHLPTISGELDGIKKFPSSENELTDEEQIQAVFARYAFGIDSVAFDYVKEVTSDELLINMEPFGTMDKRAALQTLKLHRCKDKFWTHPGLFKAIDIKDDTANVSVYRMAGHRQRTNPLILTQENIDKLHACARYEIKMRKENGFWKLTRMDYYLGILTVN